LTCNAATHCFPDFRGQMAKIGFWGAKNGPPEPLSWHRIWGPPKLSPPKGEKIVLGHSSTILQTFTPIGVNVAEISRRRTEQEAQLSQRDRATLRVIEYFAKWLKITQGHSKWHCWVQGVCKSLLVFHWNYVCRTVYETFSVKEWHDLETGVGVVQGHWKWRRSICDFQLVGHCKYSCMLYHFQVVVVVVVVVL